MEDQAVLSDTIEALRKLSQDSRLRPEERQAVAKDLNEIDAFSTKLENGRIEIAAFGEVSAGKSALLNALAGKTVFAVAAGHGSTREIGRTEWKKDSSKWSETGFARNELILVNTPGINEAEGDIRAKLAQDTVRYTDLILFVTDSDLNGVEMDALRVLRDLNKPILIVVNKVDLFKKQEIREITVSIAAKVNGMINASDIVFAAGAPREREREIQKADGSVEIVNYQPQPVIEELETRIIEILEREGKAIMALNANLFASDVDDRIKGLKQQVRGKEVVKLINYCMGAKAIVVAANPVPVFDIAAGIGTDAFMIQRIAAIYGAGFSIRDSEKMVWEILRAWGLMAAAEYGLHFAADLLKGLTLGAGTVLTAVPQGLAAAWSTYVVGNAANIYFRDGGWGSRSPKEIVREILESSSAKSVLAPIREKLKAKFGR